MTDDPIFRDGQGISQALADTLAREWPMPESLRNKAVLASDLQLLFDATQAIGWVEHTGDWDWRVYVRMNDGTVHGTREISEELDVWADTIYLRPYADEPRMSLDEIRNNIWADPNKGLILEIEEFYSNDPDPHPVQVPLREVAAITYEEL